MRQKKKKEEVTRIRNLVGMFLSVMACKQALQFMASSDGTRKRVVIACVAGRRRREARRKTIPLASSFAFGSRVNSRDDSSQNLELARRLLRRSFYVVTDFFMYIPFVVDNAYTCDSRIKKFKEDEKERKLAEKKAKEDAARAAAEEKERVSIDTLSE